jgi:hypothetical protein
MELVKDVLLRDGYAVVPSVLTRPECDEMNRGLWAALYYISNGKLLRGMPSKWSHFYTGLVHHHSMLIQNYGIGHAKYVWDLRVNDKILNVFSSLWQVPPSDLLVSFDGVACHLPPEVTNRGSLERARSTIPHIDQSLQVNDLQCYQSWVTANPVREGDATLLVYKGSHLLHEEFAEYVAATGMQSNEPERDWYQLNAEQEQWYASRCQRVKVTCPAGSLVVWDSRAVHMGVQASQERSVPNLRNVAYLCYTPRYRASAEVLKKRIKWFVNAEMTSHLPHNPCKFSKKPHIRSKEQNDYLVYENPPELNAIGRRLVGYD